MTYTHTMHKHCHVGPHLYIEVISGEFQSTKSVQLKHIIKLAKKNLCMIN